LESVEKNGNDHKRKDVPKRLYFRVVAGGRVKLSGSDDLGGSWLCYVNLIREVIEGKRSEAWFQFVEDTDDYKTKRKNR
jgi:hypothetical protein